MTSFTQEWNLNKTLRDLRLAINILNRADKRRGEAIIPLNLKDALSHRELWRLYGALKRIEKRHEKELASPRQSKILSRIKKSGLTKSAIYYRMHTKGMTFEEALSTPRMIVKKNLGTKSPKPGQTVSSEGECSSKL